jgi:hypothetical protein
MGISLPLAFEKTFTNSKTLVPRYPLFRTMLYPRTTRWREPGR